jgi:hypothetical protein
MSSFELGTYLKSSSASAKAGRSRPRAMGDVPRYIYGAKIRVSYHIQALLAQIYITMLILAALFSYLLMCFSLRLQRLSDIRNNIRSDKLSPCSGMAISAVIPWR